MTDSVVVEGYARLRDGKKWKTRWLVLRKPSPVADCLLLLVFKDKSDKVQGNKERLSATLEELCGLEVGPWYEGVAFTLAILCLTQTTLLGFDSKEALLAWDARLRYSLGEVHRFSVGVLPGTKLESGPATLHLCNNLLALARDLPPVIVGHWNLPDLRRYGPVPNGFVFEGGTRCGYWAGVFLLASAESEQISFLFDCIVRGISPTRGPFGLRPVLPDPSTSETSSEERLNHETLELEKRLSMLSHRSSTASYCPSAGGDDRSISGSSDTSDTSQSDCSVGSRLTIWTEPTSIQPENLGNAGAKAAAQSGEKPLPSGQGGGSQPPTKPPRQLQEIGRQSSSDSGIATGSHSSYSGSFSSYTGSLDSNPGEDYGSVFSLPPHLGQDVRPCTCLNVPGHEYQIPTSLRYLYDTPRSVLQEVGGDTKDNQPPAALGPTTEPAEGDKRSPGEGHLATADGDSPNEHFRSPSESKKSSEAPSGGHPGSCCFKTIVTICAVCGGFKGTPQTPAGTSVAPAIPEHPADQSVDKSARGPGAASESGVTARNPREGSPLLKGGREKGGGFLADLFSFPTDRRPEAKINGPNLYESMSRRYGNRSRLPSRDSAAIYENCLKCVAALCRRPPRVAPADVFGSVPKSREHGAAANQEPCCQISGEEPQSEDGPRGEDKRLGSKEERRRADPAYEIMESRAPERNSEAEERKYELMGGCGQRFLQESEGRVFVFPPEAPLPERPQGDGGATYVNIPISPTSKRQLNYMELELQETGAGTRVTASHPPSQRKSSTKYAQIDITATETAHKVGTQHALGRQEGLHTLELRRKAPPH
ncbi:protein Dok-7 isoform X1 [Takifugu flavidus]|uniref:protein Dok-7 isoform X1 n=1 Tax=Takifugu flavidus TaxID=433684 RepID=UPI002544B5E7|nr:protein Dok-7 isoform X1 [Takifugu flavidus]XP_056883139.1 protein Dok-7 isoform X1 [Takifugu flavidus]